MHGYLISIGGTGARVAEAVIHLCASGLGPESLTLLFVDPDQANGNVQRTIRLARIYEALQSIPRSTNMRWLGTRLRVLRPEIWSPFSNAAVPKLEDFLLVATLEETAPEHHKLLSVCYGPQQLGLDLRGGFRAMPSIGAAVFGAKVDTDREEPWRALLEELRGRATAKEESRVFVCGSIFGGTGAAGFPTIGRLLRTALAADADAVPRGGALLLPYFSFRPPRGAEGEIFARSEDFLVQTLLGLKYYATFLGDLGYDRIYLAGDEDRSSYRTAPFAGEQINRAHFVELLAATAAVDFFADKAPRDPARRVALSARADAGKFDWTDVPYGNGQGTVQSAVGHYARASFMYLESLYPALERVQAGQRTRIPWLVSLFNHARVDLGAETTREALLRQKELSVRCLTWLQELQGGAEASDVNGSGLRVRLFERTACPNLEDPSTYATEKFPELVHEPVESRRTVRNVWLRLSDSHARDFKGAGGIGYFQSALYAASR